MAGVEYLESHSPTITTMASGTKLQQTTRDSQSNQSQSTAGNSQQNGDVPHERHRPRRVFSIIRRKIKNYSRNFAEFVNRDDAYNYIPPPAFAITSPDREHIELSHFDEGGREPLGKIGMGHNFLPVYMSSPTWCDQCGDFIWGLYKQCLQCQYCNYTCHHRCRPLVSIDCPHENTNNHRPRGNAETSLSEILQVTPGKVVRVRQQSDDVDSGYSTGSPHSSMYNSLTQEELRTKVETFNLSNPGLAMTMPDDSDTFQGFIRVNMNLTRPISMSLGTRPPSIYEVLTNEAQGDTLDRNTITSFYLPRDTVKALFVNSATTVRQVIDVLLRKFKITDNPRKFALYEQSYNDENKENPVKLRKLTDNEHPLMVCLDWPSARMEHRKFVLQENDMQEILWEEFSLPELQNFLKILDKEEQEYIQDIKYKFKVRKIHMQELLTEKNPNQEKGEKKGSKNKAE